MLYAIVREHGHTTGGTLWRDLSTVKGYFRRAARIAKRFSLNGKVDPEIFNGSNVYAQHTLIARYTGISEDDKLHDYR